MSTRSTHVSRFIATEPATLYAYLADISRWPEWAAGIATGIRPEGEGSPRRPTARSRSG